MALEVLLPVELQALLRAAFSNSNALCYIRMTKRAVFLISDRYRLLNGEFCAAQSG
jgi:hypothetical protein